MLSFDIAMSLVICLLSTMCLFSVEGKLITWLFLLLSVNCLFVCLFVCLFTMSVRLEGHINCKPKINRQ